MPVNVYANYGTLPTLSMPGVFGVKILGNMPVSRSIHVALVLDTSGSMEGERITSVKNTLTVLIDKLSDGDKLTVVGFASKATTLLSNYVISESSRAFAKQTANSLVADGGTNIEAGIAELALTFASVPGTAAVPLPDSIVLLTDGYVNEGLTSIGGIYSLLNSYLPSTSVYSLGYGDNHNSDFLKGISGRTNGAYTFIDNEIALPASIGDLLGGLQDEVAKSATLTFPDNWTCMELNHVPGQNFYTMGSLIADKPTWVIFSVPLTAASSVLALNYQVRDVEGSQTVNIPFTQTMDAIDSIEVSEQQLRCITADALDKVSIKLKAYDLAGAKDIIVAALASIAASPAGQRPLAIRMKAQIVEMSDEITVMLTTPQRPNRMGAGNLANMVLRTNSTSVQYQQQRGVSSSGGNMFSSPRMIERTTGVVSQYSQIDQDPDNVHDTI